MSRRLTGVAVLALLAACFGGVPAVGAGTSGPPGGTPPFDPPPPPPPGAAAPTCTTLEIHPVPCRLYTVTCAATATAGTSCTATVTGDSTASVRKVALRLPRRFVSVELACRLKATNTIACRVVSDTVRTARGLRTVVLGLPKTFSTIHIACATNASSTFVCRLKK